VRIAIRHRYRFAADGGRVGAELKGPEAWDSLRVQTEGPFGLPATREAWERLADEPLVVARAQALDRHLAGARVVASYGVGTGGTELALARLEPGRRLVVTEFAPATTERLAKLFAEADVRSHDLRRDPPISGADVHLLYRIDTELDDDEFAHVFRRFASVPLLVVATELLGPRAVARELVTLVRGGASVAGLVRSRGSFESLWRDTHRASIVGVHDLSGWLLTPRS
jgi:hypothetical protein